MKRMAAVLLSIACGGVTLERELAEDLARPAAEESSQSVDSAPPAPVLAAAAAAVADPCTLVNGRNHQNVVFTTLQIDSTDPKCGPPYSAQGSSSVGALPFDGNRCGCCPATLALTTRQRADGGTEPVCHVTSSCQVCFNGGDSQMSCDLWFNERGTFTGTQESVSNGQLCPYVKVGLNNTGAP